MIFQKILVHVTDKNNLMRLWDAAGNLMKILQGPRFLNDHLPPFLGKSLFVI